MALRFLFEAAIYAAPRFGGKNGWMDGFETILALIVVITMVLFFKFNLSEHEILLCS